MKLVTFTRDMLPIRVGETRVYPDHVVGGLIDDGLIEPDPPEWPEKPGQEAAAPAQRAATKPQTRQVYRTK